MTVPTDTTIKQDFTWLTHHLWLLLITGALVIGGIYGVETIIQKHDVAQEQKADASLAAITAIANTAIQKMDATNAQNAIIIQQLSAQNATLAQSILVRNQQVKVQVQKDATLSAQEAASRLSGQTNAAPGEIVATGDSVTLDLPITRSIVGSLDTLAATQANLSDTEKQLANETILFSKTQDANTQQTAVIEDLKKQNAEQVAACAAEVKAIKAQARKAKLKWFGIGYVAGFISGLFAGHAVGI